MYRSHVLVCGGTGCTSSGSHKIMEKLKEELAKQGLTDEVAVVQTGCHGLCALGPIMIVYPDAAFYSMVKEEDIPEIVSEHLLKGRVVKRLLYQETVTPAGVKALIDTDFIRNSTASLCATAASSTPNPSKNTSEPAAMRPWARF